MKSGYVMDFSDRTFQEFVADSVGIDIFNEKYNYSSGSKANRLRCFITVESDTIVAKLLDDLLSYWLDQVRSQEISIDSSDEILYEQAAEVVSKLKGHSVDNLDAIQPNSDEKDFIVLARNIRESIERNEPETALDRLHTFTIKYTRELCSKVGIDYERDTPLHSLFGTFVKELKNKGLIDSVMSERILRSSISILEAFNDVRNNKSFAHDNPVLNYNESILIFNSISNIIKFLQTLKLDENNNVKAEVDNWNNLEF